MTNNDEGAGSMSAPSRVPGAPTRRQLWLRRQRRKATIIAVVSTVATFGGIAWLITSSSGWPKVKTIFFNGERLKKEFAEMRG